MGDELDELGLISDTDVSEGLSDGRRGGDSKREAVGDWFC